MRNLGSTGVLEVTGIMAVPESSRFLSISPLADGRLQLTVAAEEGHAYEIQRSTDLQAWQPLATVTNTAETFTYIDATPRNPLIQFYPSTLLSPYPSTDFEHRTSAIERITSCKRHFIAARFHESA